MGSRPRLAVALLILLALATACTEEQSPPAASAPAVTSTSRSVSASGDRNGLTLRSEVTSRGRSLFVETAVRNTRPVAAYVDADQCGRVAEVVLARTVFQPEGETHTGSIGSVKEFVLRPQRFDQNPDRFQPRRVTGGAGVPECASPQKAVTIASGDTILERWELPFADASGLLALGSPHTVVRAEVVESETPDSLHFHDIIATGEADEIRRGRNLRVERPTSDILHFEATAVDTAPSLGQLFDRMMKDDRLRGFLASQPAGSWRQADLVAMDEKLAFTAVTIGYERAITATVSKDGHRITDLRLPGVGDRTRVFERRTATLPPGVARIPEEDGIVPTDDIIADRLVLPSGQVVADAYFNGESEPLEQRVRPGSYPVHVTLGRYPGADHDRVALASLVVSPARTVKWQGGYGIAVDGGTAGFTSAEGQEALGRLIDVDMDAWVAMQFAAANSLTAHDHLITEAPIDHKLNFVIFSTGLGDGGYPVFVGLDGNDQPTRFVIDFGLLHLDWPVA